MGVKVRGSVSQNGAFHGWLVECPACGCPHCFDGRWTFNGDHKRPTFRPSMLVECPNHADPKQRMCHSFLTDGVWEYLPDCTHDMAGQKVEAPDWASAHPPHQWHDG